MRATSQVQKYRQNPMSHPIKVRFRGSSSPVMQIWMAFNEKIAVKWGYLWL